MLPYSLVILSSLIEHISPLLRESTPLFTKHLRSGISMAEDPGNGQSFGINRCKLIINSFIESFGKNIIKHPEKMSYLEQYIMNHGYDIQDLHLRPNSFYPYDFSSLIA